MTHPRLTCRTMAWVLCLALLGTSPAKAQDSCVDYSDYPDLQARVPLSGIARGLKASGSLLYVASHTHGLQVVDISDPGGPVKIGSMDTPGQSTDLDVAGDLIYLADGDQGLQIISVTNPTMPLPVGSLDTFGLVNSIQVVGDLAYLGAGFGSGGLIILDVSAPDYPAQLSLSPAGGNVRDVAVSGNHAYVADYGGYIYVFDVSDPVAPVQVALVETADAALDLAIEGSVLAVAAYHEGIQLFDLGDPANPQFSGGFKPRTTYLSFAYDVVLEGSRGYCATNDDVIVAFDLSDPSAPRELTALPQDQNIETVFATGGLVFAALGEHGVQIIQDSGVDLPEPVGKLSVQQDFAPGPFGINEGFAVVASDQLVTVRLNPPTSPVKAGSASAGEANYDIALSGHFAYIIKDPNNQILVYDLANPWVPQLVGIYDTAGNSPDRVLARGDYLYSGPHNSDIAVFDIADPRWPELVGYEPGGPSISSLAAQGDSLYLGRYEEVLVLDLADPAAPVLTGSIPVEGRIAGITVQGRYLYLVSHFHGLDILDLGQPGTPIVGHFSAERVQHITVHQGIGYLSDYLAGIYVVDLSDVTNPQLLGIKRGGCVATAIEGEHLVASGSGFLGGIEILPLQCSGVSAVNDEVPGVPGLELSTSPNPFNPQTTISLRLEQGGPVILQIHDLRGRPVRTLVNGRLEAGQHQVIWDGRSDEGKPQASGVYFYQLRFGSYVETRKMTLVK